MYKKIIRYALISMLSSLCLSITNLAPAFGLPYYYDYKSYYNFADKLEIDLEKACTGYVKISGDSGKMKIIDGKLYVVNNTISVLAADIFDPNDKFPGYSTLIDGKLYTVGSGTKLYEVNRGTSLQVIDTSDPDKIEIMDSFGEFQLDTTLLDHYHILDDPYCILDNPGIIFDVRGSFVNDFLVEDENFYFASTAFLSLFSINLSEPSPHIAGSFLGTINSNNNGVFGVSSKLSVDSKSKGAFFQSGNTIWRINISDPNNIYQEATLSLGDVLEIPSGESWIGQIKDNKVFIFTGYKFYVVDISDTKAPQKIAELPLDSHLIVTLYPKCEMLVDDNLCYIIARRVNIFCEFSFDQNMEDHSQDLITLDISDPNHPLFVSDLRIAFAPFDKKDLEDIDPWATYSWWIFNFENLHSYNGYVFIEGEADVMVEGKKKNGTRIYVVDTGVPDKPNLVGYIDFPYVIKDMNFAHNCLYLSLGNSACNEDSTIYRYDLAKILPERIASSSVSCPQPEENQQPVLGGGNDSPKEASGTTDIVKPEEPESPESLESPEEPQQPSGLIGPVPEGTSSSVPKETSDQQDQQKVPDQEIPEKEPDVPAEKPPVSAGEISPTGEMSGSEGNDKGDQLTSIQSTSIQPSYWPAPLPYWLSCNMLSMILPVPVPVKSSLPSFSYYPPSFSFSSFFSSSSYPYGYFFLFASFAAWPQEASGVSWYLPALPFPFYAP